MPSLSSRIGADPLKPVFVDFLHADPSFPSLTLRIDKSVHQVDHQIAGDQQAAVQDRGTEMRK